MLSRQCWAPLLFLLFFLSYSRKVLDYLDSADKIRWRCYALSSAGKASPVVAMLAEAATEAVVAAVPSRPSPSPPSPPSPSPPSPPPASANEHSNGANKTERTSLLNPPHLAGWRRAQPDLEGAAVTPRPRPRPRAQYDAACCALGRRWCSGTVCCCILTGLATLTAAVLSFQPIIVETLWPVSEPPPPPPPPSAAPEAVAKAGPAYIRNAQGAYLRYEEGVASNGPMPNASDAPTSAGQSAKESAQRPVTMGMGLPFTDGDRHFVRAELPWLAAVQALLVCACVVCCSRRHAAHGHLLQQRQQLLQQAAQERAPRPKAREAPPGQVK